MSAAEPSQGRAPAEWRAHRLERLAAAMDLARLAGDEESFGKVAEGYRVNVADLEAFRAHTFKVEQDLAALLRTMRIERVAPPRIHLAIDNTRPGAQS